MVAIAIIEQHRMTRTGIGQVLNANPGFTVVACVAAPDDPALTAVAADVYVVSQSVLAAGDAAEVVSGLAAHGAVLILSSPQEPCEPLAALRAGAAGIVTPDTDECEFVAAVDAVARGAFYVASGASGALHGELERSQSADTKVLARREVETLRLIAHGYARPDRPPDGVDGGDGQHVRQADPGEAERRQQGRADPPRDRTGLPAGRPGPPQRGRLRLRTVRGRCPAHFGLRIRRITYCRS